MDRDTLYLTPTDTTIGFLSQNSLRIDRAKKRPSNKYYIRVVNSLTTLKSFTRVPQKYKNMVRRAKKSTFIMPNGYSFRVIKDTKHNLLLDRLKWAYSSSANLSGEEYNPLYAKEVVDIIIVEPNSIDREASRIYKIGLKGIKSIR
jgi:tRNA A37 threonylcarbamoyladenosine synthetase subunit TsaC/SUA5/YrdC